MKLCCMEVPIAKTELNGERLDFADDVHRLHRRGHLLCLHMLMACPGSAGAKSHVANVGISLAVKAHVIFPPTHRFFACTGCENAETSRCCILPEATDFLLRVAVANIFCSEKDKGVSEITTVARRDHQFGVNAP